MTKVILAGQYPVHTFEKLREMLKGQPVDLRAVDTSEAYEAMTGYDVEKARELMQVAYDKAVAAVQ